MRNLHELDDCRIEMSAEMLQAMQIAPDYDRARNGSFAIRYGTVTLAVIAGSGGGWDHVSVSTATRCPTWQEMEVVAKLFFKHDEVAMQLHVPAKDHINDHPYVLHWWRSHLKKIPLPPKRYV